MIIAVRKRACVEHVELDVFYASLYISSIASRGLS